MKKMDNMIMIGSAEKNSGKTTFSSKLIKSLKIKYPKIFLTGIKITILKDGYENPNGFSITNEKNKEKVKDTGRLFKAGADKVLWLRCDEFHIEKGLLSLFEEIPENSLIVCESNSARNYIEPALFIMIRKKDEQSIKKTAENVLKHNPVTVISSVENGEIIYSPDILEKIVTDSGKFKIA
jgi:molybdopterin-guanine dinucleotide biosynthesis protein